MALKILVVDDEADLEPLILQKFRQRIRSGELEFFFAHDGQDALDQLQANQEIQIVFSDINMPVMDGLTFLSKLAEQDRVVKTIMVSAYDDLSNIRTAMNRGAFDFLTKPIDFHDFEQTLNKTAAEVRSLAEAVAAKDQLLQIRTELDVAHRIQQSILPALRSQGQGEWDRRFDIHAAMLPARAVTGDFYDFFRLDDNRLAFAIGDVSGKGVPAAIFMAVSRTVLRSAASLHGTPGDCLRSVNDILWAQGNNGMFVTLFYGILDLATGAVEYAVAGQTPPYILRVGGSLECLDQVLGNMVGLLEAPIIETGQVLLSAGDTMILSTDGVLDAENDQGEAFGEKRFAESLRKKGRDAEQIVGEIFLDVSRFCHQALQSDDITVLALQYI
jgi:sigma-B regulation protein RsbU (phosphoserine phosphatase)